MPCTQLFLKKLLLGNISEWRQEFRLLFSHIKKRYDRFCEILFSSSMMGIPRTRRVSIPQSTIAFSSWIDLQVEPTSSRVTGYGSQRFFFPLNGLPVAE